MFSHPRNLRKPQVNLGYAVVVFSSRDTSSITPNAAKDSAKGVKGKHFIAHDLEDGEEILAAELIFCCELLCKSHAKFEEYLKTMAERPTKKLDSR